jgi:hypothetical protein
MVIKAGHYFCRSGLAFDAIEHGGRHLGFALEAAMIRAFGADDRDFVSSTSNRHRLVTHHWQR